ncbi:glutamate racemase [Planomonospora venezuelensis]|uniref:Glutamate racemase n=1 Tax=Planomonospora venezuelensis TaxID=1999 RepID=A0A841DKN1_PLAVE|nr:aspartate/glutamate racemase family protein [Planomonospora venezuelensis]MBB5967666.1 glutamate racemase [Planomonospora venezuelensis]GIN03573.1 glutamate racemase [Planomonospora venezuelensis]
MRIALIDSGLGLLATAAALRAARPDADLILSTDPGGMPWGPRTPEDVTERVLAGVRAAALHRPDVVTLACNTASVTALTRVREEYEPGVPVVGTVPAIKSAVAAGGPIAVWATPATTASAYQRDLIGRFAAGVDTTAVACPGLADAVEAASGDGIGRAVALAVAATPPEVSGIVLGCTHYDLVAEHILAAFGRPVRLHTSAPAVARQTLARIGAGPEPEAPATGTLTVLAGGRPAELPPQALAYAEGRLLASCRAPGPAGAALSSP